MAIYIFMSDSSTNIHSAIIPDKSIPNTIQPHDQVPMFNASKSDYIAIAIMFSIGGILYYIIIHSKLFQPIREYFIQWKTKLLLNTFMRNDNTIQNTSDPNYIRDILSAF